MRNLITLKILKIVSFFVLSCGVILNAHAQNINKDNFFSDIKSIDLYIGLSGDSKFCRVNEADIRASVGYVLANSPLRKLDERSIDTLAISLIVMNVENDRGQSLGCTSSINFELWRFANFKGNPKVVTVWSDNFLIAGTENSISRQINARVERAMKEFIAKWAAQN